MVSYIGIMILGGFLFYAWSTYRSFSKNLAAAKASNIRYVIVPVYYHSPLWVFTYKLWMPILRRLPRSWSYPWLDVMPREWTWEHRYAIYKHLGADTFMVVAPGGNFLWTADARVIRQMTTSRSDFPKPTKHYRLIDVYGSNVVSSEGQVWRRHRKITGPPFTEKNNQLVWIESIRQAEAMLEACTGPDGQESRTIDRVREYSMRLSLHVISCAGFGKQLSWPNAKDTKHKDSDGLREARRGDNSNVELTAGHTMTYAEALEILLQNILLVILIPRLVLRYLPLKQTRLAYRSFNEWTMYMNEMFQAKKEKVIDGTEQVGFDLMGVLMKGSDVAVEPKGPLGSQTSPTPTKQALSDDEILGNVFVFILAGHETTANSIEFSLLYLAMNVPSQRHLQKDLDNIFNGKSISEWTYERDVPKLFSSMAAAVLNEQLRLIPPVPNIPRWCPPDKPQRLIVDGRECTVPGDTQIHISCMVAHRNPRYWPSNPPSDPEHPVHATSNTDNDLEEFRPERWLPEDIKTIEATIKNQNILPELEKQSLADVRETPADFGVDTSSDTAAELFHPYKSSYIPFSEGYRACLGRRFGQVQVLAVLAVIFTQYSVELAVDKWATDEEIETMGEEERRTVWRKAKDETMETMRTGMQTAITIQLRNKKIPLRFVRRGKERFDFP